MKTATVTDGHGSTLQLKRDLIVRLAGDDVHAAEHILDAIRLERHLEIVHARVGGLSRHEVRIAEVLILQVEDVLCFDDKYLLCASCGWSEIADSLVDGFIAAKPATRPAHKLRIHTGPAMVKQLADKLREAGINVLVEGTEHVHVEAEGTTLDAAKWNVLASLQQKHGTDFGLRPHAL